MKKVIVPLLLCVAFVLHARADVMNVAQGKPVSLHGGPFFTGGWAGGLIVDPQTLVDGVFLPRNTQWDQGPVWWDSTDDVDRWVEIDLGEKYVIESVVVQADDNDAYKLLYWKNPISGSWELLWNVPNYDVVPDPTSWGMQTRPNPLDDTERYNLPTPVVTDALMFMGDMEDGDRLFSVSEIQVYGAPVPEASTLMLFGSGLSGLLFYARKRRLIKL